MLEISDLHVRYGRVVQALNGVSLTVPDGAVVAVLGSNGAGKSTLLRSISGTLGLHKGEVTGGGITFDGDSVLGRDAGRIVRDGIVQVPEGRRIFGRLTVDENLRAGAMGNPERGGVAEARDRVFTLFPRLAERRSQRGGLMSGGEQQMLAIGRALMASPKLLLMDEPSLGLAPGVVVQIGEVIDEINAQGTAVMLVEQNAAMALAISSHAYVLDVGEVSLQGSAAELRASDEVQRLYLGHGGAAEAEAAEHVGERASEARRRPTLSRWTA